MLGAICRMETDPLRDYLAPRAALRCFKVVVCRKDRPSNKFCGCSLEGHAQNDNHGQAVEKALMVMAREGVVWGDGGDEGAEWLLGKHQKLSTPVKEREYFRTPLADQLSATAYLTVPVASRPLNPCRTAGCSAHTEDPLHTLHVCSMTSCLVTASQSCALLIAEYRRTDSYSWGYCAALYHVPWQGGEVLWYLAERASLLPASFCILL